jgi:hypothetical protein
VAGLLLTTSVYAAPLINQIEGVSLGGPAGFGNLAMKPNDDGSSSEIKLGRGFPYDLNFFGQTYHSFYINTNGNISFGGRVGSYTPRAFPASSKPIIAPFWGDVDLRGKLSSKLPSTFNNIYYKIIADQAIVTWYHVGHFKYDTQKRNAFQVQLKDRSDVSPGDFDVCFVYEQLQWTTGDASGGQDGLGGTPAQVGFDAGDSTHFYKQKDSMTPAVLNLVQTSNVGTEGVWCFEIRNGLIQEAQLNALSEVYVILKMPKEDIAIASSTFGIAPNHSWTNTTQQVLRWHFDTFPAKQIKELGFDFVIENPIPGERRRVTDSLTVRYRDVNGNLIKTELGPQYVDVLPSFYQIGINIDKATYAANEAVKIAVPLTNLSIFSQTATAVQVTVQDTKGTLVEEIVTLPDIALAAGAVKPLTIPDFFTGTRYAGPYEVHAKILDEAGETIESAQTAFTIMPSDNLALTLATRTDKPVYHTTDAVLINHLIENISLNVLVDDALLTMTIKDSNGQILRTENRALNQLPPNGLQNLLTPYMLTSAPLGHYTVEAVITKNETTLASQSVSFKVENDLKLAIGGYVDVQSKLLYPGQFQACTYTLTNQGTENVQNLPVEYQVINLDTLDIIVRQAVTADIATAGSYTSQDSYKQLLLEPGNYACVLQAQLDNKTWQTVNFDTFTQLNTLAGQCSTVYAINDEQKSNSRLFSYDLNDGSTKSLGPLYLEYDLEGLDLDPFTHRLYATSGKENSRLYIVDGNSGDLTPIGDIGFSEVESLSFNPNEGSLVGFAREGLIEIDPETGQGTLLQANHDKVNLEGLAWDNAGTTLYATGKPYGSDNETSYLFIYENQQWVKVCDNLPGEIEGLEMRPDNLLVFGINDNDDLKLHTYDPTTCQSIVDISIITPYNDIEGIAWPEADCTATQLALQAFLPALTQQHGEAFIDGNGLLQVTLQGQTHKGQLAEEMTQGPLPLDGKPRLAAIPDANGDGIGDFLFTDSLGKQQIIYYLGVFSGV